MNAYSTRHVMRTQSVKTLRDPTTAHVDIQAPRMESTTKETEHTVKVIYTFFSAISSFTLQNIALLLRC